MAEKNIASSLEWKVRPEPPVEGYYHIDLAPDVDLTEHDGSMDADFRRIHTPYIDFFPVDVLAEMQELSKTDSVNWLRKNEQIDSRYYLLRSERRNAIKRDVSNSIIGDIEDFQTRVLESFEKINEPLPEMDVVEEYPLFPADSDPYVLINGEICGEGEFALVKSEHSLVDTLKIGDREYSLVKQGIDDNMLLEIRDGKAYYSFAKILYKVKE